MGKTIIAPIVAVLALAVQLVFGIEIPEETVNEVVLVVGNVIAVALTVYGIIKSHTKTKK